MVGRVNQDFFQQQPQQIQLAFQLHHIVIQAAIPNYVKRLHNRTGIPRKSALQDPLKIAPNHAILHELLY